MADRKQFLAFKEADEELVTLLAAARERPVTDEELYEQRISFAYGNAMQTDEITKDSVRKASRTMRLRA